MIRQLHPLNMPFWELRRREVLSCRRWSLCRCRHGCCERGDVSHGEINAQYRCNGAWSMLCSTSRPGSSMLLTAQPRDEWFRHVRNWCDTKRTPPHTSTKKDTGTGREARHWVGRQVNPEMNGRFQGQLSAYVHLAHRVFGGNQLTSMARSCHGQQSSRLVSRQ